MPAGNQLSRFIRAIRGLLPRTRRKGRTVERNVSVRGGRPKGASHSPHAPSPRQRNENSEPNTRRNRNSGPASVTPVAPPPRYEPVDVRNDYSPSKNSAKGNNRFKQNPTRRAPGLPLYGGPVRLNRRPYIDPGNRRLPQRSLRRSEPTMENLARMSSNELQRMMNEL